MTDTIIPIEFRRKEYVYVQGIPHDLKPEEARKIADVVLALATKKE